MRALSWRNQQRINQGFLSRELPLAKARQRDEIAHAESVGATPKQLRELQKNPEFELKKWLPFPSANAEERVVVIPFDKAYFESLVKHELQIITKQDLIPRKTLIPLLEPGKLIRGFQPALKVSFGKE